MAVVCGGAALRFSDSFQEAVRCGRELINKFLAENRDVEYLFTLVKDGTLIELAGEQIGTLEF